MVDVRIKLYGLAQSEGQAIMKQKNLTMDELSEAVGIFQLYNYKLSTFLGINERGFYGSYIEDWKKGDVITFIPWVQIYEILGMVEKGTTEEFMEGGAHNN